MDSEKDFSLEYNQIKEKLANILKKIDFDDIVIEDNLDLKSININSINFIKLIVEIEDEFSIDFNDDYLVLNKFPTLRDLVLYVLEQNKKKYNAL